MDTKRLVIVMVVSMALIFGWQYGNFLLRKAHPEWYPQPTATDQPAGTGSATAPAPPVATTQQAVPTPPAGGLRVVGGNPSTVLLGFNKYDTKHEHANFPVALEVNSLGASLDAATLNQYKRNARVEEPYVFQTPYANLTQPIARA